MSEQLNARFLNLCFIKSYEGWILELNSYHCFVLKLVGVRMLWKSNWGEGNAKKSLMSVA